jgi:phosphoglycerate dehydrogenase-like enzyme
LRAGRIGGAALDVRAKEPPGDADQIATLPNVILTPHIAGITNESHERTAVMVVEDVVRVLHDQAPLNPVA